MLLIGKAFASLTHPTVRRCMIFSIGLALVVGIAFMTAVPTLLALFASTGIGWLDATIRAAATVGGGFIGGFIAWFTLPALIPLLAGFFQDKVADAVEATDYPGIGQKHDTPLLTALRYDTAFALKALGLNLAIALLNIVPVAGTLAALTAAFLVNGRLLGREFFIMAASRHMPRKDAELLANQRAAAIWGAGLTLAGLALVPLANLLTPIVGVALFVHVFHNLDARKAA